MKSNITIIVAISKNGVIGKDNKMPWHVPEELAEFKKLTLNNNVVMGRKTFESIGKPLKGRKNYILTSDYDYQQEGAIVVHSFGEMMFEFLDKNDEEFYIIGGKTVFEMFFIVANKLIISEIDLDIDGDTTFPSYNQSNWKLVKSLVIPNSQNIRIIQKHYDKIGF